MGRVNHHWTYEFLFAVKEWRNNGGILGERVPVRSILNGYPILPNGRPYHFPDYVRTFDYTGFLPGATPEFEWRIPTGCEGYVPQSVNDEFGPNPNTGQTNKQITSTYVGVGFGFGIFGAIFGLLVGVLIAFFVSKIEKMISPTAQGFGEVKSE